MVPLGRGGGGGSGSEVASVDACSDLGCARRNLWVHCGGSTTMSTWFSRYRSSSTALLLSIYEPYIQLQQATDLNQAGSRNPSSLPETALDPQ